MIFVISRSQCSDYKEHCFLKHDNDTTPEVFGQYISNVYVLYYFVLDIS